MKSKKRKKKKNKKGFLYKIKKWWDNLFREDKRNRDDDFSLIEVILIIIISILFGIVIGYIITYSNSPFKSTNHTAYQEITDTYQNIVDNYYGELDEEKLADAAIKGMINSLDDPFSNYMNEKDTNEFNETIEGSFVGIGATVQFYPDGSNKIIEIYDDSPASKAGLEIDDSIIKVDDIEASSVSSEELISHVKGKKGTEVVLTISRGEDVKTITVKRDTVELNLVHGEMFDKDSKKIGYIKIDSFAETTYKQFKNALEKLEKDNMDSLIIDVRDNPGGHLLQTRQILSMFFSKKTVLYQIESKTNKQKIKSSSNETRNYPVAILINGGSASASEVVASCFKDNYKNSIIVGVKSYGKGTVQQSKDLKSGTSIKYTTQKWLTSSGEWLNGVGLEPDIVVEMNESYYTNPVREEDNQLQEAIQQLLEK